MKIAFCLFKYFPFGGLQRDFIRIARTCKQRGHEVHVYTMSWEGELEPGIRIHILPAKGWQNHTRNHFFAETVKKQLDKERHHVIVGFNKCSISICITRLMSVFNHACVSVMDVYIGYCRVPQAGGA